MRRINWEKINKERQIHNKGHEFGLLLDELPMPAKKQAKKKKVRSSNIKFFQLNTKEEKFENNAKSCLSLDEIEKLRRRWYQLDERAKNLQAELTTTTKERQKIEKALRKSGRDPRKFFSSAIFSK